MAVVGDPASGAFPSTTCSTSCRRADNLSAARRGARPRHRHRHLPAPRHPRPRLARTARQAGQRTERLLHPPRHRRGADPVPRRARPRRRRHRRASSRRAIPSSSTPAASINAVLRRVARERDAILGSRRSPCSIRPPGSRQRWIAQYGEDIARRIAEAHRATASVDLTVKADAGRLGRAPRRRAAADRQHPPRRAHAPIRDLPGLRRTAPGGCRMPPPPCRPACSRRSPASASPISAPRPAARPPSSPLPAPRCWPSTARPSGWSGSSENLRAPGLAGRDQRRRCRKLDAEPFDAILLDAPCSATGTIRRHPGRRLDQGRGRHRASSRPCRPACSTRPQACSKPGGRLVYCTCSLEADEGEQQAEAFLARHPGFRPRADRRPTRSAASPNASRRRAICAPCRSISPRRTRPRRARRLLRRTFCARSDRN